MRPITTSVKLVFKHFTLIYPLILFLVVQYSYTIGVRLLSDWRYLSIPLTVVSTALNFIVIVMSFVYLITYLYPDVKIDFSNHGSPDMPLDVDS